MVTSLPQSTPETVSRKVLKENILTPRFYTTNFEVAASMDLSEQETELQTMLAEMRADYNRHHFIRDVTTQAEARVIEGYQQTG